MAEIVKEEKVSYRLELNTAEAQFLMATLQNPASEFEVDSTTEIREQIFNCLASEVPYGHNA